MGWRRRYHHPLESDRVMPRTRKRTNSTVRRAARSVTRSELAGVIDQLRQHAHNLEIQFRRIADIQADVDELKRRVKIRKGQA
jgi:hypothetical protein